MNLSNLKIATVLVLFSFLFFGCVDFKKTDEWIAGKFNKIFGPIFDDGTNLSESNLAVQNDSYGGKYGGTPASDTVRPDTPRLPSNDIPPLPPE